MTLTGIYRHMRLTLATLLITFSGIIYGQNGELAGTRLQYLTSGKPQDQVFIHTDRNIYSGGDTIFFQGYVRDRFTGMFETSSVAMYVMLYDEKRVLADSARFRIENALSEGWLNLPPDARPGNYMLTAFTGAMQNFGTEYTFTIPLVVRSSLFEPPLAGFAFDQDEYLPGETAEVLISVRGLDGSAMKEKRINYRVIHKGKTIESTFTRTNQEGDAFIRIIIPDTLTGGALSIEADLTAGRANDIITFSSLLPVNTSPGELAFLPEGGTFIAGIPQRLAVNSLSLSGRPLSLEGILSNGSGTKEIPFTTGRLGTGVVGITPAAGEEWFARLTSGDTVRRWPLPPVSEQGASLRVVSNTEGILTIRVSAADGYLGRLAVAFTMNEHMVVYREVPATPLWQMAVNTTELPQGVGRITLFDEKLNPLAERMVYLNRDKAPLLTLSTDNTLYGPGQKAEITIDLFDKSGERVSGTVSLAVADSLLGIEGNYFLPDIAGEFNLYTYLTTPLPPSVRGMAAAGITDAELDEIMMIYGWKTFRWEEVLSSAGYRDEMRLYDFLWITITGQTSLKRGAGQLRLYTLEDIDLMTVKSDDKGKFLIPFQDLPASAYNLLATPVRSDAKRVTAIKIDVPYSASFINNLKNRPYPEKREPVAGNNGIVSFGFINPDDVKQIGEVLITAERKPAEAFRTEVEERYQYANLKTVTREVLKNHQTFEDLLLTFHPYRIDYQSKTVVLRPSRSLTGQMAPALFVIDGVPDYSLKYDMIASLTTDQIFSVSVLTGQQGFTIYGKEAMGGVIFVSTVAANINRMTSEELAMLNSRAGDLGKPWELFRTRAEFYVPAVEVPKSDPSLQVRPTLYWNPQIILDGEGPVKIEYPNHLRRGIVNIMVNGVTSTHQPFSGTARYIIR